MIPSVESVYCTACGEIRPVLYDYMPGGTLNDHDATDIICADCHFVVATLHHPKHTPAPLASSEKA